jgi:hypothetical protein
VDWSTSLIRQILLPFISLYKTLTLRDSLDVTISIHQFVAFVTEKLGKSMNLTFSFAAGEIAARSEQPAVARLQRA